MRVLRAAGVDAEREVPFGGLLQLLRPGAGPARRHPRAAGRGARLGARAAPRVRRRAVRGRRRGAQPAQPRRRGPSARRHRRRRPPARPAVGAGAVLRGPAPHRRPGGRPARGARRTVGGRARRGSRSSSSDGLAEADAESLAAGLGHRLVDRGAVAAARVGRRQPARPAGAHRRGVRRPAARRTGARPGVPGPHVRPPRRRALRATPGPRCSSRPRRAATSRPSRAPARCSGCPSATSTRRRAHGLLTVDGTRIAFRHDLVRSGIYAEAAARRAPRGARRPGAGGARRRRRPARVAPRRGDGRPGRVRRGRARRRRRPRTRRAVRGPSRRPGTSARRG